MESNNLFNQKAKQLKQERKDAVVVYEPQYKWMGEYLKSREDTIAKIDPEVLGEVCTSHHEFYFNVTEFTKIAAQDFLELFYSNPNNKDAMVKMHHQKYESLKKQEAILASCIVFVLVNIPNLLETSKKEEDLNNSESFKTYCLVAISGDSFYGKQLTHVFKPTITELNKRQKELEYVYVNGDVTNFDTLLIQLGASAKDAYKPCAEKYVGSLIAKLRAIFKDRFSIGGGVSCYAYPHERGKNYGTPDSADPTVLPPNDANPKLIVGNLTIDMNPCCASCIENKDAMFDVWKGAALIPTPSGNSPSSPVGNSLFPHTPNSMEIILRKHSRTVRMEEAEKYERKQKEREELRAATDEDGFTVFAGRKQSRKDEEFFVMSKRNPKTVVIEELNADFEDKKQTVSVPQTEASVEKVQSVNNKQENNDECESNTVSPVTESKRKRKKKKKVRKKTTVTTTTETTTTELFYPSSNEESPGEGVVRRVVKKVVVTEERTIVEEDDEELNLKQKEKDNQNSSLKKPTNHYGRAATCAIAMTLSVAGLFATAALVVMNNRNECGPDMNPFQL